MSMISAQIDELRELAGDGSMEWVAGPIRAFVLRDAADTIWQLRDDLQRANAAVQDAEHDESMAWDRVRKAEAEADRLREELADAPKCETCEAMLDCDECLRADGSHKERRRLSAENAKLRELAAGIGHLLFSLDVDYCVTCPRDGINHPCPVYTVDGGECPYKTDLRELGVGVCK